MSSQFKSCELDPLSSNILKKCLSFMVDMCNASLRQGTLLPSQHHVIIIPRINKLTADPTDVKNYRLISNQSHFCIQTN